MASAAPANSYSVLQYSYVPDILERRGPHRDAHLAGAAAAAAAGKLALAGALADPVDGALFVWKNAARDEVEAFVKADPYYAAGLITGYTIRPFMVVVGDS